jgi:hypothetical protein
MDAKTIILCIVIALILLWCFRSEFQDIGELGKGKAYYFAHPEKHDSRKELLTKLIKTAQYDLTTVHWRRVMVVAIITPLVAYLVAEGSWPRPRTLALHMIVGFLIGYAFQIHYQTNVVRPALSQANQIAKQIVAPLV